MKKILIGLAVCAIHLIQCRADDICMPEYTDPGLGIKCMAININDTPFFEAVSHLSPEQRVPSETLLRTTLEKIKTDHSAVGMAEAASDLTILSNVLPVKQQEIIEDIFLNLFVRSALAGNIDAMFSILSVSFNLPKERLSKIFTITDVDLNFSELQEKLEAELDESESSETFRQVIKKLKMHSAPTSRRSSDVCSPSKGVQRSSSEPVLVRMKK